MKKAIALVSVFALAAAVSASANTITSVNSDDIIVTQNNNRVRSLYIKNDADYKGNNAFFFKANTGFNTVAAAGDIEGGHQTSTGNLDLAFDRTSDINGFDAVVDTGNDCGCDDDNHVNLTGTDDAIFAQENNAVENDAIENESEIEEQEYTEFDLNTGFNSMLAGEDIEEQDPNIPNTGPATGSVLFSYGETRIRGLSRITYTR